MTIEEIFSKVSAHMAKGIKMHNHIANAFYFLNLYGYGKCHEYHYFEESNNYRCLQTFYSRHYNKLIVEDKFDEMQVIPTNWYKYSRMDVDLNTRKSGIKDLMKKWLDWEKDTKQLLETSYKELSELNEIAAALEIKKYILDVSEELRQAQEKFMSLEAMGYDMAQIVSEQDYLYNKYEDDDDD